MPVSFKMASTTGRKNRVSLNGSWSMYLSRISVWNLETSASLTTESTTSFILAESTCSMTDCWMRASKTSL